MNRIIMVLVLLAIPFASYAKDISDSYESGGSLVVRQGKTAQQKGASPQVCYVPGYGQNSAPSGSAVILGTLYGPPTPTPVPVPTPPPPEETPTPPGVTATPTPTPTYTPTPVRCPTPPATTIKGMTKSWADFRKAESASYQTPAPVYTPTPAPSYTPASPPIPTPIPSQQDSSP